MTRSLGLVLLLSGAVGGACGSSSPVDMWISRDPDAGAGFEAPIREVHPDDDGGNDSAGSAGTTGNAGSGGDGAGGTTGAAGTTGGAGTTGSGGGAGNGGAAGSSS